MAYIPFQPDTRAETKPRVPSPWAAVRLAFERGHRAWTARRDRHEVERMLDFEAALLADVGVSRDDVVQALTTRDPSAALARAAGMRR